MTKNIKKVGLLKDVEPAKKAGPQSTSTASAAPQNSSTQASTRAAAASQPEKSTGKKLMLLSLLAILLVVIAVPKPELIVYRKMNIQASSIYWPGLLGHGAGLLDSDLKVQFDSGRNEMSLCFEANSKTDCQTYFVEKREGLVAVIAYLLK